MSRTIHSTLRLTPDGKRLLEALSQKIGLTQTATIEQAIRQMAKMEKVELPASQIAETDATELPLARLTALASEATLRKFWDHEEEDAAWAHL